MSPACRRRHDFKKLLQSFSIFFDCSFVTVWLVKIARSGAPKSYSGHDLSDRIRNLGGKLRLQFVDDESADCSRLFEGLGYLESYPADSYAALNVVAVRTSFLNKS